MAKICMDLMEVSHAEWLDKRLHSIDGTEAAAAVGVDRSMSRLELWTRKTGLLKLEDSQNYPGGHLSTTPEGIYEEFAASRFSALTGKALNVPRSMYAHDEYDFLTVKLDNTVFGENAAPVCMTVNMGSGSFEGYEQIPENFEELPREILAQCYHYLAVMEFDMVYAALIDTGSGELVIHEIPYDEERCHAILNAEVRFWNEFVIPKIPPEPDGSDSAEKALRCFPEPVNGEPTDLRRYSEKVCGLFELRKKIKELEAREKKLRQEIILAMDGNSCGFTEKYRADFSRQTRKIVDPKLLKEQHAEVYEMCQKESVANVLKISEI